MRKISILLMPLALAACVTSPPIYAPRTPCSELVPQEYREKTQHAPAPELGASDLGTFKNWIAFALLQTANVNNADDKRIASIEIIERCEARDREAIEETQDRGFLGLG